MFNYELRDRKNMKHSLLSILILLTIGTTFAQEDQNRFPKPDFSSGYQYPAENHAIPLENLWIIVDISLLILLMLVVAWATLKKQSRKPIIWVSVISVLYFGFFRVGCVCTIGSIQNIALAMVDKSYILPIVVLLFFILPLAFAFFFGRVFCAGVCPFGALQELVNFKNVKLPKPITIVLGLIPWIYLIFALFYVVAKSSFIICKLDPFIGIFRLSGDLVMISIGVAILLGSMFSGRLFCRFICPYGVLLSLISRFSIFKINITKKECNNCQLCHNACPVDAIKPPYENKVKETRKQGVKRILIYLILLPILIFATAFLMKFINKDFFVVGTLIGLIIGITLIKLSIKRTRKSYEIDHADCVMCGRCFSYCPQNEIKNE